MLKKIKMKKFNVCYLILNIKKHFKQCFLCYDKYP